MDFTLDVVYRGSTHVVRVLGDLDLYTAPRLDAELRDLIAGGNTDLAVDLRDCSYLDSEGIKVLIKAHFGIGEGGPLRICGAQGASLRTLRIARLDTFFRLLLSTDHLKSE